MYQIVREVNRKVIMENLELPIKLEKEFILDVLKRKYQINKSNPSQHLYRKRLKCFSNQVQKLGRLL